MSFYMQHSSSKFRVMEETVTCPFNKSHQLTAKRYHLHIVKCAKQTVGRDVRICTFNAKHIIDIPRYAHHIEHCPDRHQLDRIVAEKSEELHQALGEDRPCPVDTAPGFQFSDGKGSWDDDVAAAPLHRRSVSGSGPSSYNPREAIAKRAVFRFPQEPMGKSSRRQFRSETVAMLRQIQEESETAASGASSTTAASASTGPGRRPLRLPYSSTLALAARPQRGRGQRMTEVPAPAGLSAGRPQDSAVVTALSRLTIGRGRGRGTQVTSPGLAALTAS